MNQDDPADVFKAAIAALREHGQATDKLVIAFEKFDVATVVGRWPPVPAEKTNRGLIATDQLFADTLAKLGTIGEHGSLTNCLTAFRAQISQIRALPDDFGHAQEAAPDDFGDHDLGSITGRWPPD